MTQTDPAPIAAAEKATVKFLDLRVEDAEERRVLLEAIDAVLSHGRIILGPEVANLEETLAHRMGRRYAVAVHSGTDALYLALRAAGVGPGDEVIVPCLSYIATANSVRMTGAEAVFADIGEDLNIDPQSVERLLSTRTRVIVPVHFTGRVADMESLREIADRHQVLLFEDAAQAFDAKRLGKVAGSFGDAACLSLNSMKVLSSIGEAGMILTDRADWHKQLMALRYNGMVGKEESHASSLNARMDTIQAAVLLKRLSAIDRVVNLRRRNAALYSSILRQWVEVPAESLYERQVYYSYVIRSSRRDELKAFLQQSGVETRIQHRLLMPQQPSFKQNARGEWSRGESLVRQILSLPVHEKLSQEAVGHVVAMVRTFFGD